MTPFKITEKNIKFTILDSKNTILNENDCFIEIKINRDFLNSILINCSTNNFNNTDTNFSLTRREQEVLNYISSGFNNTQIAKKLNVTVHTTKVHIHNIFNKLSVQDRTEAVVKGIRYNLIKLK